MIYCSLKRYCLENKKLIIFLFIGLFIVFGSFILGNDDFVLGYDFRNQHIYFYQEFQRLVHSGQMPFWSNNLFLGTNFYASKAYYLLGDPYAYLTLFFSQENITTALLITYILKFITAAIGMNCFLKEYGIENDIRFIPVLMYVFCGWSALFAEHPMFLTWFAFLPFLFLGLEKVLKEKRYGTFIASVFLMILSNYYFFWTTSVFLTFYWSIRFFQKEEFQCHRYIRETLKLISRYLIGVSMSMFLILPAILHLLQNTRLSQEFQIVARWQPYSIYLDIIVKMFIAPFNVTGAATTLFNTVNYTTKDLTLYCSVLVLLLLPQLISIFKGKKKVSYLVLLFIEFCFLLTPFGSSVMHGFKDATFRWTLLMILTEILIVSDILQHRQKINNRLLLKTACLEMVLIIGIASYAFLSKKIIQANQREIFALIISGVLIIVYTFFILNNKRKFLITILAIELFVGSYLTLRRVAPASKGIIENNLSQSAIDYIFENEEDLFYRIYYVFTDTITTPYNVNLTYNFKGNYTYDSLYQFTLFPFLNKLDTFSENIWQIEIQEFNALNKLCFKYLITKNESFNMGYPGWYKNQIDVSDYTQFELIQDIDGFKIYRNLDYEPFPLNLEKIEDNYLLGNIDLRERKQIILPIAYDSGWKLAVNEQFCEILNAEGFLSFVLDPGMNKVEMCYTPEGLVQGILISLVGCCLFIVVLKKEKFHERGY